jgi:N-acetylmuramoyl-L-alanine amidase
MYKMKLFLKINFFFLLVLVFACNNFQYKATNQFHKQQAALLIKEISAVPFPVVDTINNMNAPQWVGTTNFDLRKPNFVVIHHTAQNSCEETLRTFTLERTKVSAHYVICKDGTVHHMLNDYFRAWHGGVAKWGNATDINSSSIGIEIDNNGIEPFEPKQISSLMNLLLTLKNKYKIPETNFIGHADIAPTRKNDPNIHFPWALLAKKGFGVWYEPNANFTLPNNLTVPYALALVGYDVKDTTAAIIAFKRHFRQDSTALVTEADKSVMAQIIQKKLGLPEVKEVRK